MSSKTVLIVGSGAREHALAWKISQSPKVGQIFVAPGNPGTDEIADNINIPANDIKRLLLFALKHKVDLTIVGPDEPLSLGIVDLFQKHKLKIFGPSKSAAKLEWSKAFAKKFMKQNSIPTAFFEVFSDEKKAIEYLKTKTFPVVVKVSGLALGKGVFICHNFSEATSALKEILMKKTFGEAGNKVVIEDYLEGSEISIHALVSGKNFELFPAAQDHKRIYDNDRGPNTGGMGTFAPVPWVRRRLLNQINTEVIQPTLASVDFKGCLFPGLMITTQGPKVLEYNARFGDPETQSFMRLLESDLFDLLNGFPSKISWKKGFAICVVLASSGYPGKYSTGKVISGIEESEKISGVKVFQAGTKLVNKKLLTNGGRVLSVTAEALTLSEARKKVYQAVDLINFEGKTYRSDIGAKALPVKL